MGKQLERAFVSGSGTAVQLTPGDWGAVSNEDLFLRQAAVGQSVPIQASEINASDVVPTITAGQPYFFTVEGDADSEASMRGVTLGGRVRFVCYSSVDA